MALSAGWASTDGLQHLPYSHGSQRTAFIAGRCATSQMHIAGDVPVLGILQGQVQSDCTGCSEQSRTLWSAPLQSDRRTAVFKCLQICAKVFQMSCSHPLTWGHGPALRKKRLRADSGVPLSHAGLVAVLSAICAETLPPVRPLRATACCSRSPSDGADVARCYPRALTRTTHECHFMV